MGICDYSVVDAQVLQVLSSSFILLSLRMINTFTFPLIDRSNDAFKRLHCWDNICEWNVAGTWLLGGDFNAMLHCIHKKGGASIALTSQLEFD